METEGASFHCGSMTCGRATFLVLNAGSSSLRFAIFDFETLQRGLSGKIDRVGSSQMVMEFRNPREQASSSLAILGEDWEAAIRFLLEWLEESDYLSSVKAVGHRVVHGRQHPGPCRITASLLVELNDLVRYDPAHLPQALLLMRAFRERLLDVVQVACFDTSFHREMPVVAQMLPIPRRYFRKGVQRYGFHGLSYSYLMQELGRLDSVAAQGRVVLAHLGSGASLAAVAKGVGVDTTMGFTPVSGLMMGTRSGDLDPGLFSYLLQEEGMTAEDFEAMVNKESGLLGLSETSSDLRDLLAVEATDTRAAEAIALFCYQVKKGVGAFAAALGGIETLVFSGGIGENSAIIRERICEGLEFLGVTLDGERNRGNEAVISSPKGGVCVRVIPTDEELMIAQSLPSFVER